MAGVGETQQPLILKGDIVDEHARVEFADTGDRMLHFLIKNTGMDPTKIARPIEEGGDDGEH